MTTPFRDVIVTLQSITNRRTQQYIFQDNYRKRDSRFFILMRLV